MANYEAPLMMLRAASNRSAFAKGIESVREIERRMEWDPGEAMVGRLCSRRRNGHCNIFCVNCWIGSRPGNCSPPKSIFPTFLTQR
jgi:hypothetical protein